MMVLGIVVPVALSVLFVKYGSLGMVYAACAISAVSLFLAVIRFLGDKVSGFAQGLSGSPTHQFAIIVGRTASWIIFAALQIVFYAVISHVLS
jgi:hypothetical protein